jgi:tetratricopeptide (TPR) repeat protein
LACFGGVEPKDENSRRTLSVVHTRIGDALEVIGPVPEAVGHFRQALAIRQELLRRNPKSLRYRRDMFVAHTNLGSVLGSSGTINMGDIPAARENALKALEFAQAMASQDVKNTLARSDLAFAHAKLGDLALNDNPREAVSQYRRALEITTKLVESGPNSASMRRWEAERRGGLARALEKTGDRAGSLSEWRRTRTTWSSLAAAEPARMDLQQGMLSVDCHLCDLERVLGYTAQAGESQKQALAGMERLAASRSNLLVMREFANCYETFGRLAAQLGRISARPEQWEQARAWYRKSADIWTEWQARGVGDPPSFPRKDAALREMRAAEAASRTLAKPARGMP